MAGTGSYARGEQSRSVPDPLAGPYAKMAAQQNAYNARQETELAQRRGAKAGAVSELTGARAAAAPLADRMYRPPADDVADPLRTLRSTLTRDRISTSAGMSFNERVKAPMLSLVAAGLIATSAGQVSDISLGEGRPPSSTNLEAEFVCGRDRVQARFETSLSGGGKIAKLLWNRRAYPVGLLQALNVELAAMRRIASVSARCDDGSIRLLVGGLAGAEQPGSDDLIVEFAVNKAGLSAKPRSLRQ